jgi:hypothetical protein
MIGCSALAVSTGALGRMTSIYCEDPDGNLVEVATYSADPVLKLFLAVDPF